MLPPKTTSFLGIRNLIIHSWKFCALSQFYLSKDLHHYFLDENRVIILFQIKLTLNPLSSSNSYVIRKLIKPLIKNTLLLSLCGLILGCGSPTGASAQQKIGKPVTAQELGLTINPSLMVPTGQFARKRGDTMRPKYITIHSTQNPHASANARMHATALRYGRLKSRNNSLGYLSWHYSVDQSTIYQSLPDTEQGQHADYDGPGNRYSIGIEMCENRGIENIVPHQHWRRIRYSDNKDLGHKNCPHFLMTNGQPGPKWNAFKNRIKKYL